MIQSIIPSENTLINNISLLSDVASTYAPEGKSLLSVTILGSPKVEDDGLVAEVINELTKILNCGKGEIKHL